MPFLKAILMCGVLSLQKAMSGELGSRRFLVRPPEPAPEMLLSLPSSSIYLGKTLLLHVPFFWNPKKLVNPHICICGITGSGKSYLIKSFITRARLIFGARALILDWAGEYSEWVRLAGGKVVSFGKDGLNLLDLGGSTAHARTRQVVESLEMLTDLQSFPKQRRLTEDAIEQAFLSMGLKLHQPMRRKKRQPTLEQVHAILKKNSSRDPEAAEAARRIRTLLLSSGKSFCSTTIGMNDLLSGLVCVDLHSLSTESLRSLAGLSILQFVKGKMRNEPYRPEGGVSLFVVVDEAWKIAADERSDVISIVREGRKYGFGIIVASQNPTDVHKSIFSNAGTTFLFRLTLSSEREYVRSSLTYSDYYEEISHGMGVGTALVHLEMAQPLRCPRNFILEKVDGEPLMRLARIRGGRMDVEIEKDELGRRLLSLGLSDRKSSEILSEFERSSFSLEAERFSSLLESAGATRASVLSFLRELGASEKDLLGVYSASRPGRHQGGEAMLRLKKNNLRKNKSKGGGERA